MTRSPFRRDRRAGLAPFWLVGGLAAATIGLLGAFSAGSAAEEARAIPAPTSDVADADQTGVAVLAGGCFWGVQGVFQHVAGVTGAVSGYAGGDRKTASYDAVSSGSTGHAEAVRVTFDPKRISYGRILQIYFSVAHDPTQLNRQGPDSGTQYRSTVFASNPDQARIAKAYIGQLDQARAFDAPVATTIESDRVFYPAEAYHQDFMTRNPTYPYIAINDLPKVEGLKRLFPSLYRTQPALVASRG